MATKTQTIDWGGITLKVKDLVINASKPGAAGSALSTTELGYIDGVVAGTPAASKAMVVGADVEAPLHANSVAVTGDTDGWWFGISTESALGNYANAINGKLDFGTAGHVTGLGGVICAELDLGAGTTAGSYACFEAELNCPSGGKTGTRTSFMSLNAWGADVATFDTNGFLFDLNGVTSGSAKLFYADNTAPSTVGGSLRIQINGTSYYLILYTGPVTHT